jgi:cyclic pyranopterin phosphate synthase
LLQDDEILRLVRIFTQVGFDKFRLTGGEPTVRAHIDDLVRQIAHTPGVRTLTMTTNGTLFKRLAQPLAEAGLQRVNFSLDTLNPEKFRRLTRRGSLQNVWEGIQAAEAAGLTPIKVNAVVVRDDNEEDLIDLARLTLTHPWQVRFIEMMPFAGITQFQQENNVQEMAMRAQIQDALGPLEEMNGGELDGEARIYRLKNAPGTLGFISTLSRPFCASCSRARLTADGWLRLCLLRELEVDLLTPMRAGATDDELREIIINAVWLKPWGHRLQDEAVPLNRLMSEIGG